MLVFLNHKVVAPKDSSILLLMHSGQQMEIQIHTHVIIYT